MFASGTWRGFWEQAQHGRQEMHAFELHFERGHIRGHGIDLIGGFTFRGTYDEAGHVRLVKQYLGKHKVEYDGRPDGEGCFLGTWTTRASFGGETYTDQGPFLMRPALARPAGGEAIEVLKPG